MGGGEGDTGNSILETDIDVGNGEYVDEDTEEGILAGDVCMGNVDADFDGDASQKLFICIFKEESHNKIQKIGALVAGYKSGGLTFDKLEELKEFTTALVEQWSRMETAWDEAMVDIENGSVFTELEGLVTIIEETISSTLKSSELFVEQNGAHVPCAEESPVDTTPIVPAVVNGAKESQGVWDTDHEKTWVNVKTIITSPKGPIVGQFDPDLPVQLITDASRKGIEYCLVQTEEGRQLLIKAGSLPLNPEEGNYAVVRLELLVVQWATNECHVYLVGTEYTIVTGSRPLLGILSHECRDDATGIQRLGQNVLGYKCRI